MGQSSGGNVQGLLENPLFNVGLGLLQANNAAYGESSNPYGAVLGGLQRTQGFQDYYRELEREERLREALERIYAAQPPSRPDDQLNQLAEQTAAPPVQVGPDGIPVVDDRFIQPASQPDIPQVAGATPPILPPTGPPPFGTAPGSVPGGFDEVTRALLQYGTPAQQTAAFTQLGARERFREGLAAEEARYRQRPGLEDPIHSTQILEDGRILQTHRSGKTSIAEVRGEPVRARNPLQYLRGPGGEVLAGDRQAGQVQEIIGTDAASQRAAQAAAATASAQTGARISTENVVKARQDYPRIRDTAQSALDTIQQLRTHPGREAATGLTAYLPSIRGPARDFDVLLDQAKGKVFLEAYQSLKGGGQITEVEGLKAEQAVARLEAAQTEEAFLRALDELEQTIIKGHERALAMTGQHGLDDETESLIRQYGAGGG